MNDETGIRQYYFGKYRLPGLEEITTLRLRLSKVGIQEQTSELKHHCGDYYKSRLRIRPVRDNQSGHQIPYRVWLHNPDSR